MRYKFVARALALFAAAATAAACQQFSPDNETRTLSFNHSVAESTNQLLLLNIIRDAQRTPTYFTRLGTNSANSTFSPSLSLTFPFGTLSSGQGSGTPSASAQNSLALENLDDNKYQKGAMSRVDVGTVKIFWDEGVQPDALGLLFISTISLPAEELSILKERVKEFCSKSNNAADKRYCNESDRNSPCLDNGVPLVTREGRNYAFYINDPAWEYGDVSGRGPAKCFQIILRDLLALGLRPVTRKSHEELDPNVPNKVLQDGSFRADMIKGGFEVGSNDAKTTTLVIKTSEETVFALDADETRQIRRLKSYRTMLGCQHDQIDDVALKELTPARKALIRKRLDQNKRETESECDATLFTSDVDKDLQKKTFISTAELKIDLSVRAFEGVVYYLGEIVRSETVIPDAKAGIVRYYPTIVARARWGEHSENDERLFVVRKGSGEGEVALAVKDDHGENYWIPDSCGQIDDSTPVSAGCAIEYPNHESLTVLTLLNQLWGLQKEPSVAPTRTISVGGG